jgi:hypothetical protein
MTTNIPVEGTTPMTHNIGNLPKWAQTHIGNHAAKLERLEYQLESLQRARNAGPEDTDTFLDHVIPHDDDGKRFQRLPQGARIVWWTGEDYPIPHLGRIDAYWDPREQAVVLTTSGAGRLSIEPRSSNRALVREVDR